ncbi:hypothetical protein ACFQ4C_13690 [Larkinella insperata]|uniref:Uncharacterized protein n=1 Tax=Larkinella insperata TaxID=332158 RepID=A0ABW3QBW1_9BACT|nr:hypothetical protein [Larkinella insperata]
MAIPKSPKRPSSGLLILQLDRFRAEVMRSIIQVVAELDGDLNDQLFDLNYLPPSLSSSSAEISALSKPDDESLILGLTDGNTLDLDDLSTDDLVKLYQLLTDLATEITED